MATMLPGSSTTRAIRSRACCAPLVTTMSSALHLTPRENAMCPAMALRNAGRPSVWL
jgi:hypothetical protein